MNSLLFALLMAIAPFSPLDAQHHRLPSGYKHGRCLLQIEHRTYISGTCAYNIGPGGAFEMHGPHQIWAGIDYPATQSSLEQRSNDYFVQVDPFEGTWIGAWNWDKRSTHAHTDLGELTRKGACWVNARVRVCLWK